MKQSLMFIFFAILATLTIGQNNYQEYDNFVKRADSFYRVKDYKNAALAYSKAFKSIGWIGTQKDRIMQLVHGH